MNILIAGSGGREHALGWKIAQSSEHKLFFAPGNGGTGNIGTNLPVKATDFEALARYVKELQVELVVVGPEEPLVNGIYEYFKEQEGLGGVRLVGPSKRGAMLEGSKDFAKEFMVKYGIPTAAYKTFTRETAGDAEHYIKATSGPYVLKADGLAAGKGVIIVDSAEEATGFIREMLEGRKFGAASDKVVIEQFLKGIELSVFVITDGRNYLLLPEAKDYKRIGEGDTGPNTGGMGSVSPVPFADEAFMEKVRLRVIEPTMKGLQEEKIDYKGFIFFGLMNVGGDPYVIEYNARLGDPETESIMPRIKNDLVPVLYACAGGDLSGHTIEFDERAAATIILASGGYPGDYKTGYPLSSIEETGNSLLFHAGTRIDDTKITTSGGRVMAVTSLGDGLPEALEASFATARKVQFEGKYFRNDIGFDVI